jgi:hypothetical protein
LAQQYPRVVVGNITKPIKGATKAGRGNPLKGPSTMGAFTNQSRIKINLGTNRPRAARRHISVREFEHFLAT